MSLFVQRADPGGRGRTCCSGSLVLFLFGASVPVKEVGLAVPTTALFSLRSLMSSLCLRYIFILGFRFTHNYKLSVGWRNGLRKETDSI